MYIRNYHYSVLCKSLVASQVDHWTLSGVLGSKPKIRVVTPTRLLCMISKPTFLLLLIFNLKQISSNLPMEPVNYHAKIISKLKAPVTSPREWCATLPLISFTI